MTLEQMLKDAHQKSSEGMWSVDGDGVSSDKPVGFPKWEDYSVCQEMLDDDAHFCALVHNKLPMLLKQMADLREALKQQLEGRISDSQSIKGHASDFGSWVHQDDAQDATIEACRDVLTTFNLEEKTND